MSYFCDMNNCRGLVGTFFYISCCGQLLESTFGFLDQFLWRVGVFDEYVERRGDWLIRMNSSPTDCLIDAVENGGVGVLDLHIFCWLARSY